MRALVCHHLSDDRSGLRFESDWPEPPPPRPGEVTVALSAAALNYPDVLMLRGGYQYAPPLPFIPGVEACGTVVAAGVGARALAGARVIVCARSGCFAERITVPAAGVRLVPEGLDDTAAAAHTVAMLTAYVALVRQGRIVGGERVAVAGAGGGTGLAAVAMAAALGAEVVALASSEAKLAAARAMGATDCRLVARGKGVDLADIDIDIVFDPVGGAATPSLLRSLRRGGRYLVIGFVGGIPQVALNRLLLREIDMIGVRAGEYARRDPVGGSENLRAIDAMAAAGMRPHIGLTVLLANADDAFAAMTDGRHVGKAIVSIA